MVTICRTYRGGGYGRCNARRGGTRQEQKRAHITILLVTILHCPRPTSGVRDCRTHDAVARSGSVSSSQTCRQARFDRKKEFAPERLERKGRDEVYTIEPQWVGGRRTAFFSQQHNRLEANGDWRKGEN